MKSYLISIILSAVLAAYPVIGSAAGGAFTGSKSSSASLNALTKTSSKLERRKRISGCFKRAMRNGDIPGTTDRIGLKKIVCSGGSHLIVATIPVVSLGEPEAQEHFEEAMNELSWRSPKMDQPFGLLVDLVGDDFYAAYDASFFLDSGYGPITLVSSAGRAEFDALFGMEPEDFAHVVQSLADPQVFYSAGGTILKWTAAGAAFGAGIGLVADATSDGTTNGNLDSRYGSIDNGSDSVADGSGWGAAIGAGVGFVVGVAVAIYDAVTGADDEDDEDETE